MDGPSGARASQTYRSLRFRASKNKTLLQPCSTASMLHTNGAVVHQANRQNLLGVNHLHVSHFIDDSPICFGV